MGDRIIHHQCHVSAFTQHCSVCEIVSKHIKNTTGPPCLTKLYAPWGPQLWVTNSFPLKMLLFSWNRCHGGGGDDVGHLVMLAHTYRFSAHTYRLVGVNSVSRLQSVGVCWNLRLRSALFHRLTLTQILNRQWALIPSQHVSVGACSASVMWLVSYLPLLFLTVLSLRSLSTVSHSLSLLLLFSVPLTFFPRLSSLSPSIATSVFTVSI